MQFPGFPQALEIMENLEKVPCKEKVSVKVRFGHESFRPWVDSAGSFGPDFRVGCFAPHHPLPIFYNINETDHNDKFSFMLAHTSCVALQS